MALELPEAALFEGLVALRRLLGDAPAAAVDVKALEAPFNLR